MGDSTTGVRTDSASRLCARWKSRRLKTYAIPTTTTTTTTITRLRPNHVCVSSLCNQVVKTCWCMAITAPHGGEGSDASARGGDTSS